MKNQNSMDRLTAYTTLRMFNGLYNLSLLNLDLREELTPEAVRKLKALIEESSAIINRHPNLFRLYAASDGLQLDTLIAGVELLMEQISEIE